MFAPKSCPYQFKSWNVDGNDSALDFKRRNNAHLFDVNGCVRLNRCHRYESGKAENCDGYGYKADEEHGENRDFSTRCHLKMPNGGDR